MLSIMQPTMPMTLFDTMVAADSMLAMHPFAHMHDVPRLVEQEDGSFALTLSAPGVNPNDIKVSVNDDKLEIAGQTRASAGSHVLKWSTRLPRDADTDAITVSAKDGLVSITVPKKPEAAPTQIEVSATAPEETTDDGSDSLRYTLTLSLPGLAAADVSVSTADGVVTVSGETKRTGVRVAKSMRLPRDADCSGATASHVDGLLTLTVPKKPPAEAKKLIVNDQAASADDVEMV